MPSSPTLPKTLLRLIAILYLFLFVGGLACSGYFLSQTLAMQPILMIRLLQYALLCILFIILSVNSVRALTLRLQDLTRLANSTRNFKWLFVMVTLLCAAAWLGIFNRAGEKKIEINAVQMSVLLSLVLFCFWSDHLLNRILPEEKD